MSRNSHPRLSLPGSVIAGVVLMFAMPLAAQVVSYTYIDQKAPYKNSGMLTALNLPKVGTTFKVQVPLSGRSSVCWWAHCPYPDPYIYSLSYLAIGVRNPNVTIPALGGFLFTSADIVLLAPWGPIAQQGTVTMSFPIPNSQALLGVKFYQQVLVDVTYPWARSAHFYSLSRGGVGVIGK